MPDREMEAPPGARRPDEPGGERRAERRGRRRSRGRRRAPTSLAHNVRGRRGAIGAALATAGAVLAITFVVMSAFGGDAQPRRTPQARQADCFGVDCTAEVSPSGDPAPEAEDTPASRSMSATPTPTPTPTPSASASAPTDRPPSVTPTTSRPARGRPHDQNVRVSYATVEDRRGEFVGSLTMTNRTGQSVSEWRLVFSYPGEVQSVWPNQWRHEGDSVVVTGGGLGDGQSTMVSFRVDGRDGPPSTCSFNGRPCGAN